jgi:hypothetical protein
MAVCQARPMSEGYEGAAHSAGCHTRGCGRGANVFPDPRCCVLLLLSQNRMSRQQLFSGLFVIYSERRNGANAGWYCACRNGCDRSASQKNEKPLRTAVTLVRCGGGGPLTPHHRPTSTADLPVRMPEGSGVGPAAGAAWRLRASAPAVRAGRILSRAASAGSSCRWR